MRTNAAKLTQVSLPEFAPTHSLRGNCNMRQYGSYRHTRTSNGDLRSWVRDIEDRDRLSDNTSNACRAIRIKTSVSALWTGDKAACEVVGVELPTNAA